MSTHRMIEACLLVVLSFGVVGCTITQKASPSLILVNNTGGTMAELLPKEIYQRYDGYPDIIAHYEQEHRPVILEHRQSRLAVRAYFDFSRDGIEYRYNNAYVEVPKNYRTETYGRDPGLYVLQVQSDGAIYVLPPMMPYPNNTTPPQPEGYPLIPIQTGAKN